MGSLGQDDFLGQGGVLDHDLMAKVHAACHLPPAAVEACLLCCVLPPLPPREPALLCRLCTVIAEGLVQRWTPLPGAAPPPPTSTKKGRQGERGGGGMTAMCAVGQPH